MTSFSLMESSGPARSLQISNSPFSSRHRSFGRDAAVPGPRRPFYRYEHVFPRTTLRRTSLILQPCDMHSSAWVKRCANAWECCTSRVELERCHGMPVGPNVALSGHSIMLTVSKHASRHHDDAMTYQSRPTHSSAARVVLDGRAKTSVSLVYTAAMFTCFRSSSTSTAPRTSSGWCTLADLVLSATLSPRPMFPTSPRPTSCRSHWRRLPSSSDSRLSRLVASFLPRHVALVALLSSSTPERATMISLDW